MGRVLPRHDHRGRLLNAAVRHQSSALAAWRTTASSHAGESTNLRHRETRANQRVSHARASPATVCGFRIVSAVVSVPTTSRASGVVPLLVNLVNWAPWGRQFGPLVAYGGMMPNNALERTVDYRGPHPGCQQVVGWLCMRQAAAWPAAQRSR